MINKKIIKINNWATRVGTNSFFPLVNISNYLTGHKDAMIEEAVQGHEFLERKGYSITAGIVFGSCLNGNFRPEQSDYDVLYITNSENLQDSDSFGGFEKTYNCTLSDNSLPFTTHEARVVTSRRILCLLDNLHTQITFPNQYCNNPSQTISIAISGNWYSISGYESAFLDSYMIHTLNEGHILYGTLPSEVNAAFKKTSDKWTRFLKEIREKYKVDYYTVRIENLTPTRRVSAADLY